MTTCTYDNPATFRRECWQDGVLIASYCHSIFSLPDKSKIPGKHLFFGANVGDWRAGKMYGDATAMSKITTGVQYETK